MDDDDFDFDLDLEKFRNPEGEKAAAAVKAEIGAKPSQPKRRERNEPAIMFLKFPRIWWEALANADTTSGDVYRLALCLLYESFRTKPFRTLPAVVVLSNRMVERWGIKDRRTKKRMLQVLQNVGLLTVEGRPRKSPLVTVLFAD
jgi:hypothetical protein